MTKRCKNCNKYMRGGTKGMFCLVCCDAFDGTMDLHMQIVRRNRIISGLVIIIVLMFLVLLKSHGLLGS